MRWVIYLFTLCWQRCQTCNDLPAQLSPDPRASGRGEGVVYSPLQAPCQGCEWQTSPGGTGGRQSVPGGAGLGPAPHFTGVTPELTGGNNSQSLQTCAMAEQPPEPPAQQLLQLPLNPVKNISKFPECTFGPSLWPALTRSLWNAALLACLFLFFFFWFSTGNCDLCTPLSINPFRMDSRGCT